MPCDAGRDRVDAHPVLGGFDCTATGQRHHSGLGRGVMGLRVLRSPAQNTGVVHNHAPVIGLPEVAQRRARRSHDRGERDVQDTIPLVVSHIDHRCLSTQSGIVDQHVEPAESGGGRRDERIHLCGGGDVTHHAFHSAEAERHQFFPGLGEAAFVVIRDHHVGSLGECASCGRRTDTGTRRSGHHQHLPDEQTVALDLRGRGRQ